MPDTADSARYISPMSVGGLKGRVLHVPGPKGGGEVLFVYGHHSSLERWFGIVELISQYASATMSDLPGFGGMESLYKNRKHATLDNLADWLAAFIEERYPERKVTIVGMSLGFVITTRMLQRHPQLTSRVEKLISLFGFAHKDDFIIPYKRYTFLRRGSRIFAASTATAALYRAFLLNKFVLSHAYHRTANAKEKFKGLGPEERAKNLAFEIKLWQDDHTRTYMKTGHEFLTLDNTKVKINLPVYHIAVKGDRYFDTAKVEQHYRQIFTDYKLLAELSSGTHAPTMIRTAAEAEALIPPELLVALQSKLP